MKVSGSTPTVFLRGEIGCFRKFLITFFTSIFLDYQVDFQLPKCKLKAILVLNIIIILLSIFHKQFPKSIRFYLY